MIKCIAIALLVSVGAVRALSAETEPTLRVLEPWSNVFGGKETVLHISVTSPRTLHGRLSWRLFAARHTVARGEAVVTVNPSDAQTVALALPIPPVKAGVIFPVSIAVSLREDATANPITQIIRELQVYPEDPFADRFEWLKNLNLHVFDPCGETAAVLTAHGVPFDRVTAVESFADIDKGILVIGEGVSIDDYRALPQALFKAAAAGRPVLCLALQGTRSMLPIDTISPPPSKVVMARQSIIREIDKRLDETGWPPDGNIADGGFMLNQGGFAIRKATNDTEPHFSWLELDFENGTKAVMCWFGIMRQWDAGPTPRFLFARLLERVTKREGEITGHE